MKRMTSKLSAASHPCCFVPLGSFVVIALTAMTPRKISERGDVPGWVMITLMSAILVAGLLAIATPALGDLFNQAMSKVGK